MPFIILIMGILSFLSVGFVLPAVILPIITIILAEIKRKEKAGISKIVIILGELLAVLGIVLRLL